MDALSIAADLLAKLLPLAVEAGMAAQAGDAARHAQAVKAMDDAMVEARTAIAALGGDHEAAMARARQTIAERFPEVTSVTPAAPPIPTDG
jgi:hypothetical protein